MRKIILYIAGSLDGKIADAEGGVDWLHRIPNPDESDYGYAGFIKTIDTTLMGNKTYRQVLGFDVEFPYKQTENYVITRNESLVKDEYVRYISKHAAAFIRDLKNKPGKDIWCIGGGGIIAFLIDHDLLDEIRMFIMPVVLGAGIPLTARLRDQCALKLTDTVSYKSGVVELRYTIRHEKGSAQN
ncbi:MAG: dihydrofolate reductase family protein [Cytophagales bacterium]|nr:dihydrofolate reductase family protein [Cytophagales bacterium]